MRFTVNGKPREVDVTGEPTLLRLLEALGVDPRLVAVELNGDIVRRERFPSAWLRENDRLEIIHMVGGGGGSRIGEAPEKWPKRPPWRREPARLASDGGRGAKPQRGGWVGLEE